MDSITRATRIVFLILCLSIGADGLAAQTTTLPATTLRKPQELGDQAYADLLRNAAIQQAETSVPPTDGAVAPPAMSAAAFTPLTRIQAIESMTLDMRPSNLLKEWAALDADEKGVTRAPSPLGKETTLLKWIALNQNWPRLGEYLRSIDEADAPKVYALMLAKLSSNSARHIGAMHPAGQAYRETLALGLDDVIGLIEAAPGPLEEQSVVRLSALTQVAISNGNTLNEFLVALDQVAGEELSEEEAIEEGTPHPVLSRRQAALILSKASQIKHVDRFLPDVDEAIAEDDGEALNLLAQCFVARFSESRESADLELAWELTQAVLASESTELKERQAALTQAVSLSSRVRAELGDQWLADSFAAEGERGKTILSTVGGLSTSALMTQPTNPSYRLQHLRLLNDAVNSIFVARSELNDDWQQALNLLIRPWLAEAKLAYQFDSSSSRGPMMRYDSFGNVYFMDPSQELAMQQARQNQPRPIAVAELMKNVPHDKWIELLDSSLQPTVFEWVAKLNLKVSEEEAAFPYIEQLSETHPEIAASLANEFLRVWANNHNPNTNRRYTSPIYSIYGFNSRAEGIPLTRSKQQRNLAELKTWISRIQALESIADEIEESLLVRAFTISHSSAEVYRLETIEDVFGDFSQLAPDTAAGLLQQMRRNLSGLWRDSNVQKQSGTNRRKKDIEAEVLRGYVVAEEVVNSALESYPSHWSLLLAKASLAHDELDYRNELAASSDYSEDRLRSLENFRQAALAYIEQAKEMEMDEESAEVFEIWFYASLGACDVRGIDAEKLAILPEVDRIKETIESMPTDQAERHIGKFANSLFTMLRSVNPAVKHRYLRQGFKIVGDHEQAADAKNVFDYYEDLVTEIELRIEVDNPTANVGCEQPFGIFVSLRHTREIERESGGFGRYLQNQNNMTYSYNYGRPTTNYRDKFEEGVREALKEHFEVLSVTFQEEEVNSKADPKYGWRVTPYAYILLQPRGEEITRVPPLKIDLDFLDSSGYVVLPIESPMVLINADQDDFEPSEFAVQSLVQTLDERQAEKGKLILEIKATTQGLTPELESLVDLQTSDFEVDTIEDSGVSVSRYDPEADETVMLCERIWTVTMKGRDDLEELPEQFRFGNPSVEATEVVFQRYADADLEIVDESIKLTANYGSTDRTWLWITIAVVAVGLVGLIGVVVIVTRRPDATADEGLHLPSDITPFSVIHVLRDIHRQNGLNTEQKADLESDIHRLENAFFSPTAQQDADLRKVAESWIRQSRQNSN